MTGSDIGGEKVLNCKMEELVIVDVSLQEFGENRLESHRLDLVLKGLVKDNCSVVGLKVSKAWAWTSICF